MGECNSAAKGRRSEPKFKCGGGEEGGINAYMGALDVHAQDAATAKRSSLVDQWVREAEAVDGSGNGREGRQTTTTLAGNAQHTSTTLLKHFLTNTSCHVGEKDLKRFNTN